MKFQVNELSAQKLVKMVEEIQTLVKRESMYDINQRHRPLFPEEEKELCNDRSSPRNVIVLSSDQSLKNTLYAMREKICQWMYRVVDHCNYERKVTFTAINYVNRFIFLKSLSDLSENTEPYIQLLGLTALYVACKNEGCKCNLALFVKLSAGRFTANDIKSMEIDMMFTLKWLMNPPLPQQFSEFFALHVSKYTDKIADQENFIYIVQEVSNYIIEVIIQFNEYQYEKASVLASAAILIAFQGIKPSIMSASQKEEARTFFLMSLVELGVASAPNSRMLSQSNESSSHSSCARTKIDDILSLETRIRLLLQCQCSSMEEFYRGFDPKQLIYETFVHDPPKLL